MDTSRQHLRRNWGFLAGSVLTSVLVGVQTIGLCVLGCIAQPTGKSM